MGAPLEGIRVLDLSRGVAGPYATKLLADYGADVLKLEPPGGDPLRRFGPFPDDREDLDASGLFLHLNTHKRSARLDPATPEGAAAVRRLARECDIVVEDHEPGRAASWGWGWDELSRDRAELVMVSITSFGQDGPYRDYRGSEITLQAMGGPMIQHRAREQRAAEARRARRTLRGGGGGGARGAARALSRGGGGRRGLHRPRRLRMPGGLPRSAGDRPHGGGLHGLRAPPALGPAADGGGGAPGAGRLRQPLRPRQPAAQLPRADRSRGHDHARGAVPARPLHPRGARRGGRGVVRRVPGAHAEAGGVAAGAGAGHPRRSVAHDRRPARRPARPRARLLGPDRPPANRPAGVPGAPLHHVGVAAPRAGARAAARRARRRVGGAVRVARAQASGSCRPRCGSGREPPAARGRPRRRGDGRLGWSPRDATARRVGRRGDPRRAGDPRAPHHARRGGGADAGAAARGGARGAQRRRRLPRPGPPRTTAGIAAPRSTPTPATRSRWPAT